MTKLLYIQNDSRIDDRCKITMSRQSAPAKPKADYTLSLFCLSRSYWPGLFSVALSLRIVYTKDSLPCP